MSGVEDGRLRSLPIQDEGEEATVISLRNFLYTHPVSDTPERGSTISTLTQSPDLPRTTACWPDCIFPAIFVFVVGPTRTFTRVLAVQTTNCLASVAARSSASCRAITSAKGFSASATSSLADGPHNLEYEVDGERRDTADAGEICEREVSREAADEICD